MNSETLVALEFVRALQHGWNDRGSTPIDIPQDYTSGNQKNVRSDRVRVPAHQHLARQIHVIVHQVPTRDETLDWLGRRLITWGWRLRMQYGAPRR